MEETTADARGLGGTAGIEHSGDMETDLPLLATNRTCIRRCAVLSTVFSVGIVEIDRLQTERSSTGPKMELYFNESKAYRALYVLCHLHLYKFTVHY